MTNTHSSEFNIEDLANTLYKAIINNDNSQYSAADQLVDLSADDVKYVYAMLIKRFYREWSDNDLYYDMLERILYFLGDASFSESKISVLGDPLRSSLLGGDMKAFTMVASRITDHYKVMYRQGSLPFEMRFVERTLFTTWHCLKEKAIFDNYTRHFPITCDAAENLLFKSTLDAEQIINAMRCDTILPEHEVTPQMRLEIDMIDPANRYQFCRSSAHEVSEMILSVGIDRQRPDLAAKVFAKLIQNPLLLNSDFNTTLFANLMQFPEFAAVVKANEQRLIDILASNNNHMDTVMHRIPAFLEQGALHLGKYLVLNCREGINKHNGEYLESVRKHLSNFNEAELTEMYKNSVISHRSGVTHLPLFIEFCKANGVTPKIRFKREGGLFITHLKQLVDLYEAIQEMPNGSPLVDDYRRYINISIKDLAYRENIDLDELKISLSDEIPEAFLDSLPVYRAERLYNDLSL